MFFRIKVFFLLLFPVGMPSFSRASVLEGSWDLSGQVVMESRVYQKPSSMNGTSLFQIPWMTLDARFVSRDGGELFLEFLGISPPPVGQNDFVLRQASFYYPAVLGDSVDLRAGLLASELSQRLKNYWPIYRLSNDLDFALQKYNYQPYSDYGFELFGSFSQNWTWGLQVTNGEGRGVPEKGPQKDLQIFLAGEWGEERSFLVYLQGRRGGYENIPLEQAAKERLALGLWTQNPTGISAGLEGYMTKDPADAVNGIIAEQIDLTALGGQVIQGKGASVHLRYAWEDAQERIWQFFVKSDYLRPVAGDSERDVQGNNFGILYSPRVNVQWALYSSHVFTGQLHNVNTKEQQSWRLALNVDLND